MPSLTSSIEPTVTGCPNPPLAVGHRKATNPAAKKAPRPALVSVTEARLKNWRRLTPIASGSGGVHGTGATSRAGARVVP